VLNKTDLAAPLGVSVPTITQWLAVLETTVQILVVPPFYENLGKRLIKSPKLYLADSGLACHLLGIETEAELAKSPFRGALFEGFIASEIVKAQVNHGRRREIYCFRDQQGLEVDFLVPGRSGTVTLVECKTGQTVTPEMAVPVQRLAGAMKSKRGVQSKCFSCISRLGLELRRKQWPPECAQWRGPIFSLSCDSSPGVLYIAGALRGELARRMTSLVTWAGSPCSKGVLRMLDLHRAGSGADRRGFATAQRCLTH